MVIEKPQPRPAVKVPPSAPVDYDSEDAAPEGQASNDDDDYNNHFSPSTSSNVTTLKLEECEIRPLWLSEFLGAFENIELSAT